MNINNYLRIEKIKYIVGARDLGHQYIKLLQNT